MSYKDIAVMRREPIFGAYPISKDEWRDCHSDYKGGTRGDRSMLALDPKTGATVRVPVVIVAVSEIREVPS